MKDQAEQDALLEEFRPLVMETAYRLGQERDEDALQNGLIGLWEATQRWDGSRPFEPLARCCIRHNIIDYMRRRRDDTDELPEDVPDAFSEEAPETKEELLERVKMTFPRRSRESRVLRSLLAGKSKRQIADRLGVSPRTVDRVARRAWEKLDTQSRRE